MLKDPMCTFRKSVIMLRTAEVHDTACANCGRGVDMPRVVKQLLGGNNLALRLSHEECRKLYRLLVLISRRAIGTVCREIESL